MYSQNEIIVTGTISLIALDLLKDLQNKEKKINPSMVAFRTAMYSSAMLSMFNLTKHFLWDHQPKFGHAIVGTVVFGIFLTKLSNLTSKLSDRFPKFKITMEE